jgi:DNA-binding response OmpR family regulator
MKLLIIEDDKSILEMLKRGLEDENFVVDTAETGEDGEYMASSTNYDIIILDWMLPKKSGIEVLKSLREKEILTPILMLTAKDDISSKIEGFNSGADDYLSKPFSFDELLARLNAIYRRSAFKGKNIIKLPNHIEVDFDAKIVKKSGKIVDLTAKEYELLEFLLANRGSIVSNEMIQEQLWSNDEYITSNVIQVIVYRLRNKLAKDLIKSKRNLGYYVE